MPIYCYYSLSLADAIHAGTDRAGSDYYPLSLEDVRRIRDQSLDEVASPYLSTVPVSYADGVVRRPTLAIESAELPAAMFSALAARRDQLARVRDVAALADRPSWDNLQTLAWWANDEIKLRLAHPPEDVAVPGDDRDGALEPDATEALVLVRWANKIARALWAEDGRVASDDLARWAKEIAPALWAEDGRAASDVHAIISALDHLLDGGLPAPARRRLRPGRSSDDWLPEDIRDKLKAFRAKRSEDIVAQRAQEDREAAPGAPVDAASASSDAEIRIRLDANGKFVDPHACRQSLLDLLDGLTRLPSENASPVDRIELEDRLGCVWRAWHVGPHALHVRPRPDMRTTFADQIGNEIQQSLANLSKLHGERRGDRLRLRAMYGKTLIRSADLLIQIDHRSPDRPDEVRLTQDGPLIRLEFATRDVVLQSELYLAMGRGVRVTGARSTCGSGCCLAAWACPCDAAAVVAWFYARGDKTKVKTSAMDGQDGQDGPREQGE